MTNQKERGAGSLGGDETNRSGALSAGSGDSTMRGLGSTDLGGSDFDATASDNLRVATGSTMGGGDLNIESGTTGAGTTTGDRTEAGKTTASAGGSSSSLPGVAMGALAGAAIGAAASALLGSGGEKERSSSIERDIEVNAPLRTVYNQWTQFEEFPQFMQGVEQVQQLDDKRLHWRAEIGFKNKEWDAEIVDQVPDQRITWRSISGAPNGGTVSFQPVDANRTRVSLRLDYDPEGLIETAGDTLGVVSQRVEGDLERFKQFIESRGAETGGWRGEIHKGQ